LAAQAQADGIWDDCLRSNGNGSFVYQTFPPTTIHLGRDTQIGDVIGPWITAAPAPAWICTRRQGYSGTSVQVFVQGAEPYAPALGTLNHDGQSYVWYRLGDDAAQSALGYIVRWRASTGWTALNVAANIQQDSVSSVGVVKNAGEKYNIQVETQIRLVKRSNARTL